MGIDYFLPKRVCNRHTANVKLYTRRVAGSARIYLFIYLLKNVPRDEDIMKLR